MDSAVAQLQSNKWRLSSTQIFFAVCAIGWIPFLASSFNYQAESWFPWLLSARIFAMIVALIAAIITYFVPRIATHSELAYSVLCVALQASFGILEGGTQTAFTNFVSVFVLMVGIFTRLKFSAWLRFGFLPTVVLSLLPVAFKNHSFFESVAVFVDAFSPIVSALAIGFVIGHSTCTKNAVLARNKKLQEELTRERDHQSEIIQQQLRELSTARVSTAVAQAAQMLAHDIRKPLSMLRMVLNALTNAKSTADLQKLAITALPDVTSALDHADSLIRDVLAVSTTAAVKPEPVSTNDLVDSVARDIKKLAPSIAVQTKLQHKGLRAVVDTPQIKRVFENIATNACEAMGSAGRMEISTEIVARDSTSFVRFRIWNSGPSISNEDAIKVFELFFTKGKSGGTGLGLAIAHKIVIEHGGRIWCEQNVESGAAFAFEIPAAEAGYEPATVETVKQPAASIGEARLAKAAERLSREIRVLHVDDDATYRIGMEMMLESVSPVVNGKLVFREAQNATETLAAIEEFKPDVVFLDIDLGYDSASGLDVLAQLRSSGNNVFVCIHSNRLSEDPAAFAREHGANGIAAKPISREQLLDVLTEGLDFQHPKERLFAFVDDCEGTRVVWETCWPNAVGALETFSTPEEFWKRADADNGFLNRLTAVFSDLNFGKHSATSGKDLALRLRDSKFAGSVFITTAAADCFATDAFKVCSKELPSAAFLENLAN